ncbi:MAG TPA: citrate/2-methylcitrate synthase, partial [Phycisphaerales bacterium]|nr:citrate/2-methylcitrate synthase [Phycisphaerales bacterium]
MPAPTAAPAPAPKTSGLEGIIAGQTAVGAVAQDKLVYRGYEIHDLADHATFDEVAFVLLVGHKPSPAELAAFKKEIVSMRELPPLVVETLQKTAKLPFTVPMDTLRTAISVLAHVDPDCQSVEADADLRKAKRLLAQIPTIIGHMQNIIDGKPIVKPDASLDHAANLLWMMTGKKPSAEAARVIDVS